MTSVFRRFSEASATSLYVFWSTIQACLLPIGIEFEAELGGDHHLVPERSESFAHEFFIGERAVCFGGVEECHAPFDGGSDQRNPLLLTYRLTVARAQPHTAKPESGAFQVPLSKFAFLHCSSFAA